MSKTIDQQVLQKKTAPPRSRESYALNIPAYVKRTNVISSTDNIGVAVIATTLHPECLLGAELINGKPVFYFKNPKPRFPHTSSSLFRDAEHRDRKAFEDFGDEAKPCIINALNTNLENHRELSALISTIKQICMSLPDQEGITLKGLYRTMQPHLEQQRAIALRHIRRLQQAYDYAFKTSLFTKQPKPADWIDIDELKQRINLVDIVSPYVPLRRSGTRWVGRCPFHQERTPSFVVFAADDDPHAHCYGCGWHGDFISFLQKIKGVDFKTALMEVRALL